jgi:N-acetylmuramoyl-L-alanine amidase
MAALPSLPRAAVRSTIGAVWRHRVIAIPVALAIALTASASGISLIRVHRGDTLSAIALRYHTTVAALVALNNLPGDGNLIIAGEQLKIPGAHRQAQSTRHHTRSRTHVVTIHHTVVSGDTLYGIAAHYHVRAATIARRNHLPKSLIVVLGESLAIPHLVHTTTHTTTSSSGGATSQADRDRAYLARRSVPDRDETKAIIEATANKWGVDPSLALAIGWQESGWSMHAVSPVDALGVMQVMPYTGAYLSDQVVHRHLDLYDTQDNITAGIALLSVLTHEASSTSQAIAGYYQGLQSVRDHGMYASTKQYVANVNSLKQGF